MSAFIRKMVLNGYMIIPEWPELKKMHNQQTEFLKKALEAVLGFSETDS